MGFVHVPGGYNGASQEFSVSTLLYQLIATGSIDRVGPSELMQLILELEHVGSNVDEDGVIHANADVAEGAEGAETPLNVFSASGWSATDTAAAAVFWQDGYRVAEALAVNQSAISIVSNGRVGLASTRLITDHLPCLVTKHGIWRL